MRACPPAGSQQRGPKPPKPRRRRRLPQHARARLPVSGVGGLEQLRVLVDGRAGEVVAAGQRGGGRVRPHIAHHQRAPQPPRARTVYE
eukprot:COSAG01_NODE_4451_length_5007_cov_5.064181_6_plen_88_part_00